MEENWQTIVVGILFAAALFYVYKTLRKSSKGHANCKGCDPLDKKTG